MEILILELILVGYVLLPALDKFLVDFSVSHHMLDFLGFGLNFFYSAIPVCFFTFLYGSLTVWYCKTVDFSDSGHFNYFGIFFLQITHFCSIHFSL